MATSPMLQAVLLFQNHQTTSPFLPHPGSVNPLHAMETLPATEATKPKEEKTEDKPPFDTEEENDKPENGEDDEKEQEGEQHA